MHYTRGEREKLLKWMSEEEYRELEEIMKADEESYEKLEDKPFEPRIKLREYINEGDLPEGKYLDRKVVPPDFDGEIIKGGGYVVLEDDNVIIHAGENLFAEFGLWLSYFNKEPAYFEHFDWYGNLILWGP